MGNWGPETLVRTWGSGELGTRDFRSLGAGGQDPYKVQSPAKPSPMSLRQSTLRPECLSLQSFGRDRREPTGPEGVTKVRTARRVPTGNFRRTEPAQPSPGHRGDSSKMPLRDSERFGPSAHHLRVRSASTQAHSFPRGLRAVSRPGTPGGSANLGEVVPSRSAFLLASLVWERPR